MGIFDKLKNAVSSVAGKADANQQEMTISFAALVCLAYVVVRLLSGQHFFTDIVGGLFLSASIIALFIALKLDFVKVEEVKELEE